MESEGNKTKTRGQPHRFKKGETGNPNGRPKQTQQQKDALQAIRQLAPSAVEQLRSIINDSETPTSARIKAIEIVLDRTYGKPDMAVKVETNKVSMLQDIAQEMEMLRSAVK